MTVPRAKIQIFDNYDKSMVDKCHGLKFLGRDSSGNDVEKRLLCVFASPERAFAQVALQLARRNRQQEADLKPDLKKVPLPIMSIERVSQTFDTNRYVRVNMDDLYIRTDGTKYLGSMMPQPYDLTYQLDIWARTITDADYITNQVLLWERANEFYLHVDHDIPFGHRIVLVELTGMTKPNTQVDPRDESQRVLRNTFTFVVHGWLLLAPYETSIIDSSVIEIPDDGDINITEPPDDVTPPVPIPRLEMSVTTVMFNGLIPGDAIAATSYAGVTIPAAMELLGMQAAILGTPPSGSDLELRLELNGVADAGRRVVISAGSSVNAVIFGSALSVVAGDRLAIYCQAIGSTTPGSWIQTNFTVRLPFSYT